MGKTDKISHKKVKGEKMEYRSVSLPTSLVEDLAILRECYEDTWFPVKEEDGSRKKRKAVSYEKVFERLLSKSGLGHVDPDVYQEFVQVRKTRKKFLEVVKLSTRKAVEELAARAQENGTSQKEEARNASVLTDMAGTAAVPTDQELQEDPRLQEAYGEKEKIKRTEKRFVHPDGRWYPAVHGTTDWVPVNPDTGRWMKVKPVKDAGFKLMDVEV